MAAERASGSESKFPAMNLSYGSWSSARTSRRNKVVVVELHVSWCLTPKRLQTEEAASSCEISRNLLIFCYDLYHFFSQYKSSPLNFLHCSSEASVDNTKATLIQGDLLPSQLLSQSCCHDEIRLHSRVQMSNAREAEH